MKLLVILALALMCLTACEITVGTATPVPTAEATATLTVVNTQQPVMYVTADVLSFRSTCSEEEPEFGYLTKGMQVRVIARDVAHDSNCSAWHVVQRNSFVGCVCGDFLTP